MQGIWSAFRHVISHQEQDMLCSWLCICQLDCAFGHGIFPVRGGSVEFSGTRGRCLVISGTRTVHCLIVDGMSHRSVGRTFGILISKLSNLGYRLARNLDSWNVYRKGRSTHNSVSHLDSLTTSSQGINHQDLFSLKSSLKSSTISHQSSVSIH